MKFNLIKGSWCWQKIYFQTWKNPPIAVPLRAYSFCNLTYIFIYLYVYVYKYQLVKKRKGRLRLGRGTYIENLIENRITIKKHDIPVSSSSWVSPFCSSVPASLSPLFPVTFSIIGSWGGGRCSGSGAGLTRLSSRHASPSRRIGAVHWQRPNKSGMRKSQCDSGSQRRQWACS